MNWIKKRYDQFLLVLLIIALFACAVLIFLRVQSFGEKFSDAMANVVPNNKVPPVPLEKIDDATKKLENPPVWNDVVEKEGSPTRGSLFVSEAYVVNKDTGVPEQPWKGTPLYKDSLTGNPIPNKWFLDNNLPLLEAKVVSDDPDKDGFTNEDEWRGHTDPNNKESHPAYVSKLFLKQQQKIPFRLVLKSYDGDPKKTKDYTTFSFQIETIDKRQPSEFLKLGEMVPNTKFKLEKFEFKEQFNPKIEEKEDVSELTVADTESGDKIVLILNRVTDSPDVYAIFEYEWPQPVKLIRVKKFQEFLLLPDVDEQHHYKLIDIKETEAQIKLPDGTDYTVTQDPRHAAK